MTKIYYNNLDVFSGLAPTPLIQLNEEPVRYGNLWAISENIVLNGQITGQCQTFSQLLNKQNSLISNFSNSFKSLKIDENGSTIYNWPLAKVKSINFGQAKYNGLLDFSISLECYDSGKFSGYYGVIDPKNEISYSVQDNGFVVVSHKTSAKGLNTNTSVTGALLNAKNYISTISGWDSISGFSPVFITQYSGVLPVLTELRENIDRFNNIYSIEESWSYDPTASGSGLLSYTISETKPEGNWISQVNVDGSLNGGKNIPIETLRTRFSSLDISSFASAILIRNINPINTIPLSFNISESSFENRINFSYTFDTNTGSNPYLIDSITITDNNTSKSSASFKGTFKYRGACLCNNESGWLALEAMVNSYDYYNRVLLKWNKYGKSTILSSYPISNSITKNRNSCEISVEKTFSEVQLEVPNELEYIDVILNVKPSIAQFEGQPVIQQGTWYITNLGYRSRSKYTLQGVARIKPCIDQTEGIEVIKNYISSMAGSYIIGENTILDQGEFSEADSDNKLINFNFTWSAMGAQFTI